MASICGEYLWLVLRKSYEMWCLALGPSVSDTYIFNYDHCGNKISLPIQKEGSFPALDFGDTICVY